MIFHQTNSCVSPPTQLSGVHRPSFNRPCRPFRMTYFPLACRLFIRFVARHNIGEEPGGNLRSVFGNVSGNADFENTDLYQRRRVALLHA